VCGQWRLQGAQKSGIYVPEKLTEIWKRVEGEGGGKGGVREVGEEGMGSGIPKVVGSGRKRENYAALHNILQIKKCKEAGANKYRAGTRIKGYRKQEVYTPLSPPQKRGDDKWDFICYCKQDK